MAGALLSFLWKWEILGETQKIVCGNAKKSAKGFQILQAGFIAVILQVGDLALGHMNRLTQLRLIQFFLFPQKPDLFSQSQFHVITAHRLFPLAQLHFTPKRNGRQFPLLIFLYRFSSEWELTIDLPDCIIYLENPGFPTRKSKGEKTSFERKENCHDL